MFTIQLQIQILTNLIELIKKKIVNLKLCAKNFLVLNVNRIYLETNAHYIKLCFLD